jgi:ABC-type transporter lipoprotein component MlaA/pimeloyl-ACP methyl ester carboxylesterase
MRTSNFHMRGLKSPLVSLMAVLAVSCGGTAPEPVNNPVATKQVADPLEPMNRATWELNRGVTLGVLEPATNVYLTVVPNPVRRSIGNFRDNLTGPLRITNQILQGRWDDSGEESLRFLANTTVGIGGLFDVADRMNMPGSRGSFNQTFRHWGWQPDTYVVLPFLGPSDNVAAPARVMDVAGDPVTYVSGLEAVSYPARVQQLSDIIPQAASVMRTESDSYDLVRQAWPYLSRTTPPDWTPRGAPDFATMETLAAARYKPDDPWFVSRGKRHLARLPHTGKDFPYQAWMRNEPAPLVFLSPGIGSHRMSGNVMVLAEAIHNMGFSVVTISGIFHPEFMERASSSSMPGNPVTDRADLLATLTVIDASLHAKYRGRVTKRVLAGFSLGGFSALQLAATEADHAPGSVRFDQYLAIQAPADLRQAYRTLDEYYAAPASWPETVRAQRLDNTFHKVAALIDQRPPEGVPPFNADESRLLVGFAFRIVLRDSLYSIHRRTPSDLVSAPTSTWRREDSYRELMNFSFDDYLNHWLAPEEREKGVSEKDFFHVTTLRPMGRALGANRRVHFIGNRNDFLISPQDMRWMDSTLGNRAIWLPSGGHLGNLGDPQFFEVLGDVMEKMR